MFFPPEIQPAQVERGLDTWEVEPGDTGRAKENSEKLNASMSKWKILCYNKKTGNSE